MQLEVAHQPTYGVMHAACKQAQESLLRRLLVQVEQAEENPAKQPVSARFFGNDENRFP